MPAADASLVIARAAVEMRQPATRDISFNEGWPTRLYSLYFYAKCHLHATPSPHGVEEEDARHAGHATAAAAAAREAAIIDADRRYRLYDEL